jgi:hypothetical protein
MSTKDKLKKTMTSKIEDEVAKRTSGKPKSSSKLPTSVRSAISVSKMYKTAGDIKGEELEEEMIEIALPHPSAALSQIGYNARMTINLGDFESVQIGVSCVVPCYQEEVDDAFLHAKQLVDLKLNKEVGAVREFRKDKGDK